MESHKFLRAGVHFVPFLLLTIIFSCADQATGPTAPAAIVTPQPGSRLLAEDTISVAWTGLAGETVTVLYRDTAGLMPWQPCSIIGFDGSRARIALPAVFEGGLLIGVAGSDTLVARYLLTDFILTRYPRANATYNQGDTIHLAWRMSASIAETIILLMYDGGERFGFITGGSGVSFPDTSHSWIIGNPEEYGIIYPVRDCFVTVMDYVDPNKSDVSPGMFHID